VCSKTLETVPSAEACIERMFDPKRVREVKARELGNISVGGCRPRSSGHKDRMVDECHLFVMPLWWEAANRHSPPAFA
jgi:hypothetical protein